jgi:hypothetical protein
MVEHSGKFALFLYTFKEIQEQGKHRPMDGL